MMSVPKTSPNMAENFLGISSPFLDPKQFGEMSAPRLQQIDHALRGIASDVLTVTEEFRFQSYEKYSLILADDFDVIHSAVDWRPKKTNHSFWSSVVINFLPEKNTILPGSMFELLEYAKPKLREQNQISSRELSNSLFEKFLNLPSEGTNPSYQRFVKKFQEIQIANEAFYLISVMQQHMLSIQFNASEVIDQSLINICKALFARGTRIDKDLNNYIDSYNLALVVGLNQNPKESKKKYLIVSNSTIMKYVNDMVCRIKFEDNHSVWSSGCVWTARQAAIYKLLAFSAPEMESALQNARTLYGDICNLRNQLDEVRKSVETADSADRLSLADSFAAEDDKEDLSIEETLIRVIPLLNQVGDLIEKDKEGNNILPKMFGSSYNPNRPREFHKEVVGFINSALDKSEFNRFKEKSYKGRRRKEGKVFIEDNSKEFERFHYNSALVAKERGVGGDISELFGCLASSRQLVFWVPIGGSVELFFEAYKRFDIGVRRHLSPNSLRTLKEITQNAKDEGRSHNSFVMHTENRIIESDIPESMNSWEFSEFKKRASAPKSEVIFLKFRTVMYTVSFEGDVAAVVPHGRFVDEISDFFKEISQSESRLDWVQTLDNMIDKAGFQFNGQFTYG
ncbi:MAG: hypothetical protein AAGA97_00475 [Pseudomonadota bacterium]